MKITIKQPVQYSDGKIDLQEVNLDDVRVNAYALLSIDGSTTNSGLSIIREYDGALMYTITAKRDDSGETPVHYKIRLKRFVKELLLKNKNVYQVYYEEPVIHNASAVRNLFMLRSFVEELIIEEEPDFNYIKHYEVSNMRWKKEFLAPDKVPVGTENQKKAVRDKLVGFLPFLEKVTQDEIDSIAMGWVAAKFTRESNGGESLQSKTKPRPFKYNIQFIGADDDDVMISEFFDVYEGPKQLLEHSINFSEIDGKTKFDNYVYNKMNDEDKILIIKFSSKKHGDLILKHRVGNLSAQYDYLYAVVWRVTRK